MQLLLNKILLLAVLAGFIFQPHSMGQTAEDLILIKTQTSDRGGIHKHRHKVSFLLSDHPSPVVRYNPVTIALGSIMWTYQKIISPQFSSTCIYSPSCSSYSKDLIYDFGILRGIIFTADRLMRCNRIALIDFKSWEIEPVSGKIKEGTSYYRLNE